MPRVGRNGEEFQVETKIDMASRSSAGRRRSKEMMAQGGGMLERVSFNNDWKGLAAVCDNGGRRSGVAQLFCGLIQGSSDRLGSSYN